MGAKVQKLVILVKIHLTFTPHMTPFQTVFRVRRHARERKPHYLRCKCTKMGG